MIRKDISIMDALFDDQTSDELCLSVKITENSLIGAALNKTKNIIFSFEKWSIQNKEGFFGISESLKKIYEDSSLLKRKYNNSTFLIDTGVHTIIPEKFFSENDAKKYLEFNFSLNSNEKINTDDIKSIAAKNIYLLPAEIEISVKKLFQNYCFQHVSSVLAASLLSMNEPQEKVLVNISSGRIDILASKNKDLLFCNSFYFKSAEDMIYYILQVYKQLNLDPQFVPVMLAGDIEKKSAAFEIIYKYIKDIFFCKPSDKMDCIKEIKEMKDHKNYCLFNSFVCAS
jgi:hypothetical protein